MTVVTDEQIDACGFRMFELPEIARTMQMHLHPNGGDYIVRGNKREVMAQLGNAVTPPVMRLLLERVIAVIGEDDFIDLFCGAGGSSIGAEQAGGRLRLGLNHWALAIETHATNFPNADHDCADVSALTTAQIRRYPDSAIMLASPECTNHSLAKGALRRKPQSSSLFEDGPAGDDEQDRSRATMWDVVRFAEQKILKGKPYKAIIVENVTDAFRWGANDDGGLFAAWRMALTNLGYESEIVWLNSMFAPPTPQSRDRMYVVFWRKGVRRPNLKIEPLSWCPSCERLVAGQQTWKRPDRPLETRKGTPTGARYGIQYLYGCPECASVVLPGVYPAATAIDFTIEAPKIGDRSRPLAANTRERIRRGLVRLIQEPFAIRLTHGGVPRPLTLPIVTLTRRHDLAMVIPVAGNTFERTPGNRARDAERQPMDTVHGTLDKALVIANRAHNVPRDSEAEAAPPILTGGTVGIVELQRNGGVRDAELVPAHTLRAAGFHHALIMRNNGGADDGGSGWESTPAHEPVRTLTGRCHQSLVMANTEHGVPRPAGEQASQTLRTEGGLAIIVPYQSEPHGPEEPAKTITTRERLALVVPPSTNGAPRLAQLEPSFVQVTETRPMLVEPPE